MRKKLLLLSAMVCVSLGMFADYSALTFTDNTGERFSINTENLVITVADGQLQAVSGDNQMQFVLTDLASMEFTNEDTSGVEAVNAVSGGVTLYSVDGSVAGTFSSLDQAKSRLPEGVYVVTLADGGILKIYIKK